MLQKRGSLDNVNVKAFYFLHILATCTSASDLHVRYVNDILTNQNYFIIFIPEIVTIKIKAVHIVVFCQMRVK